MFSIIEVSKCGKQFRVVKDGLDSETKGVLARIKLEREWPGLKGRLVVQRVVGMVVELRRGEEIVRLERSGSKFPSTEKAKIMARRQAAIDRREKAYQALLALLARVKR